MSQHGFTDWQEIGVFPLQDFEADVPAHLRQQIVGGRILKMTDPSKTSDPDETELIYAESSLGDIHPWMLWQTADTEKRGMGSWAQAFATVFAEHQGPTTGGYSYPPDALPFGSSHYQADLRYEPRDPDQDWPKCLSVQVAGSWGITLPSVDERSGGIVTMPTDPRLWCPSASGPTAAGTLVVDLQPDRTACMDGSTEPGKGGRHALLQSMMRVVAMAPASSVPTKLAPTAQGNGLAWNLGYSWQGTMAGYGMVFGQIDRRQGEGEVPITGAPRNPLPEGLPPPPTTGGNPFTGNGAAGATSRNGGSGSGTLAVDLPQPDPENLGKEPHEFGAFAPRRAGSFGVAFVANAEAFGPIHLGHEADVHQIGLDRDGHPMNSAHISTNAYFYRAQNRDGPLLFEGKWPDPAHLPLQSVVHLTWDGALNHPFIDGPRPGFWRWWAEVPVVVPTGEPPPPTSPPPTTPPRTPSPPSPPTPGTPATPRPRTPGRPTTPAPTAPGPPGPSGGGGVPGRTSGPAGSGPRLTQPITPNPTGPYGPRFPGRPVTGGPWTGPTLPGPSGTAPWWRETAPPEDPPDEADPTKPVTPGSSKGPTLPGPSGPADWWVERERAAGRLPPASHAPGDSNSEEPFRTRKSPGVVHKVGDQTPELHANYTITHPFMESWSAMAFRPQLWVRGYPNFEHNPDLPAGLYRNDELYRPQVLAMHSWGAQDEGGGWDYTEESGTSRARGGTADGGVLFTPPEFEMEDYLAINSAADVDTPSTTSFVAAAKGVGFALGTPNLDGGLNETGIVIAQTLDTNGTLSITQLNSSRAATDLITGAVDQSTGEVIVSLGLGGNQAIAIPRGNDAARPASPDYGYIRINSEGSADVLEFWEAQGGSWMQIAGSP